MMDLFPVADTNGRSPYVVWRDQLDPAIRARITMAVIRLSYAVPPTAKSVGAGVFELRFFFGPGYRVYFAVEGDRLILLLGGGSKRRQAKDILAAQNLLRRYIESEKRRQADAATQS